MRVGIMIEGQEGLTWERWRRLVQAAEDMGFESLCRSDHLTGLWGESKRPSLETWTSLTVLATRTRRIRFGPMVSPLTFYHPALLAKMAVALDTLSGGRMDLGLGAGWNEHEHRDVRRAHAAHEGASRPAGVRRAPYPRARRRASRSPSSSPTTRSRRPRTSRCPTHRRLRIVIGGRGEKRTLRIAAEFADEWNVTRVDVGGFSQKREVLAQHCEALGARPGDHHPLADDADCDRPRPGRSGRAHRRGTRRPFPSCRTARPHGGGELPRGLSR